MKIKNIYIEDNFELFFEDIIKILSKNNINYLLIKNDYFYELHFENYIYNIYFNKKYVNLNVRDLNNISLINIENDYLDDFNIKTLSYKEKQRPGFKIYTKKHIKYGNIKNNRYSSKRK